MSRTGCPNRLAEPLPGPYPCHPARSRRVSAPLWTGVHPGVRSQARQIGTAETRSVAEVAAVRGRAKKQASMLAFIDPETLVPAIVHCERSNGRQTSSSTGAHNRTGWRSDLRDRAVVAESARR